MVDMGLIALILFRVYIRLDGSTEKKSRTLMYTHILMI